MNGGFNMQEVIVISMLSRDMHCRLLNNGQWARRVPMKETSRRGTCLTRMSFQKWMRTGQHHLLAMMMPQTSQMKGHPVMKRRYLRHIKAEPILCP